MFLLEATTVHIITCGWGLRQMLFQAPITILVVITYK